jgi:nucleotide-binding universal stress UspA family protein
MFKKILVPVDGSDSSVIAVNVAAELAMKNEGSITLLYVVRQYLVQYPGTNTGYDSPELNAPAGAVELGKEVLRKIKELITVADIAVETEIAYGNPANVIVFSAKKGEYDLIVMGSRGIGGLTGSLIGSVSQSVSNLAHCPVLLTRLSKNVPEGQKIIKSIPTDYKIYL